MRPLRLGTSAAPKQRRIERLVAETGVSVARLDAVVEDAQALGSLELAGYRFGWDEVRAARRGEEAPAPIVRLHRAQRAVPREAPLDAPALLLWQQAVTGAPAGFRRRERVREGGPPPAPAEFVESRLQLLAEWLGSQSGLELQPARGGALALARIVEILPFEEANGRVARLAASHAMVKGGARPPVLVGADAARLDEALQAAFQLETEPLAALLEEASERALDVALQALEKWGSEL
jgi:hypothetical protein